MAQLFHGLTLLSGQLSHLGKAFFITFKPPHKDRRPEDPVDKHTVPDPQHPKAKQQNKQIGKTNAEHPHGKNGNDHGKSCIETGPQGIGKSKRQGPYCHGKAVGGNHFLCDLPGFLRQPVYRNKCSLSGKHKYADHSGQNIIQNQKLSGVISGLPVFSGSHTLSCNGDQTKSKGIPRQICDRRQIIGHCIAGQGRRSQGRNQALKRQLPHLENTVFQPVGNPQQGFSGSSSLPV